MVAMEVVTAQDTAAAAAMTAMVANAGNSLTVRSFPDAANAYIWDMWAQQATAGALRVHSARLHDDVQGILYNIVAGTVRSFFPTQARQKLYPNDVLRLEHTNGGAETDIGAMLIYYEDLPGVAARLAMWDQVKPRIVNLLTNSVVVAAPVAGNWSAGTAINATTDLLKADTDYAILGYACLGSMAAVGIQSADTGNLRVGGPGTTEVIETRDWFVRISTDIGGPAIPIFNSNNRGSTLISVANTAAAGTTVYLALAQLSQ